MPSTTQGLAVSAHRIRAPRQLPGRFLELLQYRRVLQRRNILRDFLAFCERAQQPPHDFARARFGQSFREADVVRLGHRANLLAHVGAQLFAEFRTRLHATFERHERDERLAGERAACRVEFAKVDLTDQAARESLFEYAGADARRALVISEGLLVYLTPEQVGALGRDLHHQLTFQWWLFDLGSPRLLRMLEKTWGSTLRAGNAPLLFAPAEGTAFFEPSGWREREYRSVVDESIRLKRTFPLARFWRFLSRFYPRRLREEFRRMSGIVLLERI